MSDTPTRSALRKQIAVLPDLDDVSGRRFGTYSTVNVYRASAVDQVLDQIAQEQDKLPEIRILTCKQCGCPINCDMCSYACPLDDSERELESMEMRVYQLVKVEAMPLPAAQSPRPPRRRR